MRATTTQNGESPLRHFAYYRASAFAGASVALLCALLPLTNTGERAELRTHDLRFRLRGPRQTNARIVIVAVHGSTLAAWPEPSLFWGTRYARVIATARANGASAIGLDFIPAVSADDYLEAVRAKGTHPDSDLANAIESAGGSVVLTEVLSSTGSLPVTPIPRFVFLPEAENRVAFVDLPTSADGAMRTYAVSLRGRGEDGETRYSLAGMLAGWGRADGVAPRPPRGGTDFYINYTGSSFRTITAERMEAGALTPAERTSLRGATVLVGENYPGGLDNHPGPNGGNYEGVAIHAEALASLEDGATLWRGRRWMEALLTLAAGGASATLTWLLGARRGAAAVSALLALILAAVWAAFVRANVLLPLAAPGIAVAVAWLVVRSVRSVEEGFRRLRAEAAFGRSVTPAVRDYLLAAGSNQELGGARRAVTVLFFDLRGSTRYAQEKNPADMVAELNDLFAAVVPLVEANGGIVNRFLGDGFLAIFGWPESPARGHAQAAADAARAMVAAMPSVNARRAAAGLPPWRIGCAVHTGEALCGNVGVLSRTEFTFMGDVINRTAHMERLNKEFGTQIVLSETTMAALSATPSFTQSLRDEFGMCVYGVD